MNVQQMIIVFNTHEMMKPNFPWQLNLGTLESLKAT